MMKTLPHLSRSQRGLRLLLLVGCSLAAMKLPAAPFSNPQGAGQRAATRLAQLPLYFEANAGQTNKRVRFLARGAGYNLFLTSNGAVVTLRPIEKNSHQPRLRCPVA